jgi:hypothetical protein
MSNGEQFDMTLMNQVRDHAMHLTQQYSARNSLYNELENMFLLKWSEEGKAKRAGGKNTKVTLHPGARNNALGAIRLMTAADPEFSVPFESNSPASQKQSTQIEKFVKAMWLASGRVRGRPVHYDVVTSAILFAEMHLPITKTSDMVAWAKGGTKAAQAHAEEIAACTPYLADVWDPRTGYPELGPTGLLAYYNEAEVWSGQILDEFGDAARLVLQDTNRYTKTILCKFWDYENFFVWLKGHDQPLKQEKHGLPFIPVIVQLGEGSSLFTLPEDQRQPFLYTEWKSGMWSRLNLIMTVLHTIVFQFGSNPLYLYKANAPDKKMHVDQSRAGGVTVISTDEDFGPLSTKVVDPAMLELFATDERLEDESTIYGATLGEPLGKNAPFSMVALLHQAGRLPLLIPQRMASWAIGSWAKTALRWLKEDGVKGTAKYEDIQAELAPKDIPKHLDITATLKAELPQDKVQETNIALQASSGERPLVSQRFAREDILGLGQSDEMQREIWSEMAAYTRFIEFMRNEMIRAYQQPGPPGGQPGEQVPRQVQQGPQPGEPMTPMQPMPSGMQPGQPPPIGGVPLSPGSSPDETG